MKSTLSASPNKPSGLVLSKLKKQRIISQKLIRIKRKGWAAVAADGNAVFYVKYPGFVVLPNSSVLIQAELHIG